MTKLPYRLHHLLKLLEQYQDKPIPLDRAIAHYFRENQALGSKDRAEIADTVYGLIRWKTLFESLDPKPANWLDLITLYRTKDPLSFINDPSLPLATRVSFPPFLFELLANDYGQEKAVSLCLSSNTAAPTTVRINPIKTTREQMLARWKQQYDVSPCEHSPDGIIFHKKIHFFSLPEFKEGLFEVQDEGSQLLAALIDAKPGDHVLDFCAGAGGKTLAFASKMAQKGQIYLHDVRPDALAEAKKRLKRAGIQNAQFHLDDSPILPKLKKKMDWILVDAPCSGTGTLRRNPDIKWRFDETTLPQLVSLQQSIFEKALAYLKPGGKIVYATCSLLKEENEKQVDYFTTAFSLEPVSPPFQSFPSNNGMDGFFGIVLRKTNS